MLNTILKSIFLICFSASVCFSQVNKEAPRIKFGDISVDELKMTEYEKDPEASAVVLYDFGYSYMKYEKTGFKLYFERHKKVKILKKAGYEYATEEVSLYHEDDNSEKISKIQGVTYNLENGKIEKTKLDKEAIFTTKISKNIDEVKFTMPNVKEGSIVEFTYIVSTDYYKFLREWEFQSDIPVIWSEYRLKLYQYHDYNIIKQGYHPLAIDNSFIKTETFGFSQAPEVNGAIIASMPERRYTVTANTHNYRWICKNLPAIKEEPYITRLDDYKTKLYFDLASIQYPGAERKQYSESWESIDKHLLGHEFFGKQLTGQSFITKEVSRLVPESMKPEMRLESIYNHVKSKMTWDGKHRLYINTTLKKAYESESGNSADINLLLIAMLKEASLDANPVVLSTRENGVLRPKFAMANKLNYVVAHVQLNGKSYLLDATEPLGAFDLLPKRCFNGDGRLVKTHNSQWIPLAPKQKQMEYYNVQLALLPAGQIKGNVQVSFNHLNALTVRKAILADGEKHYVNNVSKMLHNWNINSYAVKGADELQKPIEITYELESASSVVTGDFIYVTPIFFDRQVENPFKQELRSFPVDFGHGSEKIYACTFTLPAGYKVEDMPARLRLELPGKGGSFAYEVTQVGNQLRVISKVSLDKPVYAIEEYSALREFYSKIVAKQAEQIVLKKL
jgi:hypothetical protein